MWRAKFLTREGANEYRTFYAATLEHATAKADGIAKKNRWRRRVLVEKLDY